jgi:predicted metal-dependent phosphoesterase TrpH
MNRFDLHVHSKYSNDGEFGIQEIIERCLNNEIDLLSITDHNSISATEEAITLCLNSGIELIPGIEIDCSYKNTDLHLLGYNINWPSKDFKELERSIHEKVMDSFPRMIDNLDYLGIKVNEKEVLERANGKPPCGELIAEVLLSNPVYQDNKKLLPYMSGGERSDMPFINFYLDYFSQGKPAYVKIDYMDFHEAVHLVRSNGGIPVIAHPGLNLKGKEELVIELLDDGAEGLEAFNNYHNAPQAEYFASLCVKKSLIMTCGSDFHGKNKPLIDIGKYGIIDKYADYLLKSIMEISNMTHNKTIGS